MGSSDEKKLTGEVAALREARSVDNAKFRVFFEQGSNFAGVLSPDGTVIEANRLSLEACGYTRDDVLGKKFWDCGWWNRSPELVEMVREAVRRAAAGETFRRESTYFVADGTLRYVDLILSPVRDDAGKVVFIAPTGADITDRKLAERERARLASIVESSDDAIISKDLHSVITSWNAGAERIFGNTAAEAIGRSITMLMPPERIDEEPGILERVRRGERIEHYETVRLRKDGSRIYVSLSVSPLVDEEGRIIGASKIVRDITDRTLSERTDARLAAIVESSDDAIISKDLNSVITSWNAGALRLFGYTAEEAIGRSVTMLMPPERVDEEPGIVERIRRGERIEHYETIRLRKDGSPLEISLTVSPLRDRDGRVIGASKIARDITDRKRAERALLEADRQKNEFLATLAHELRNPLAPIRNSLNVLRLSQGDPRAVERVQDMMERQVNHLVRLVDDLLELSRITTGKIELRPESVEIAAAVRNAIETSKPLIDAGGHQFHVTIPPESLIVDADPVRLSQIIANVLNNAAKYTEHGGTIQLNVSRDNGHVVISIRDTGIGIPAEMLPRVLEMFTQVDRARRHSQDGLGIGLSLVKRLIELHGGTVEAKSEGEGKGSEFVLRLPLSAKRTTAAAGAADGGAASSRRRILVVDDNRDAATSLAMLLRVLGSEVETAFDGANALAAVERFRPSVVLLDLGMPEMSGYEVARRMRELPWFAGVTLIALTGWGQEEDRRRTQEAGFGHHLVKPVQLDALQIVLAEATNERA